MRRPSLAVVSAVTGIAALSALAAVAGHPGGLVSLSDRASADPLMRRQLVIGHSVRGRPIVATALGDSDASRRVLVVGCIHGNESAGIAIAHRLESVATPEQALLWVIEDLNPDGVAAGTRQNANGVDLNRNFPWRWRPLGHRGDLQHSGPRPLSEPESRIARNLILKLRPAVSIWFHQPLGLVDESGGDVRVERRYARLAGLPLRRLVRYPGSAAGWQNHRLPGSTAFVVELPGRLTKKATQRYFGAVRRLLG